MKRVKYILIDHRKKEAGTYTKEIHEYDLDTDESDMGEIGRLIRDTEYGGKRRYYVKVLGVEDFESDTEEED